MLREIPTDEAIREAVTRIIQRERGGRTKINWKMVLAELVEMGIRGNGKAWLMGPVKWYALLPRTVEVNGERWVLQAIVFSDTHRKARAIYARRPR